MIIANLSSSIIPSEKANSVQVIRMSEAFAELGHSVILFGRESSKIHDYKEIKEIYGINTDFDIRLVKIDTNLPLFSGLKYAYNVYRQLLEITHTPDLFYGRNLYALLACRYFNKPIIYESHAAPSLGRKILENTLFASANFVALVVISEALRAYYINNFAFFKRHPEKILVCCDGAKLKDTEFKPLTNGSFVAGYAGSLYPGKGGEFIVELAQAMPDIKFMIAGGTIQQISVLSQRCPSNLSFTGYLKPNAVDKFLSKCDVLLAPYSENVYSEERSKRDIGCWMSPLKLFEYMVSKRPMVVSDLPVFNNLLINNENALLVKPNDVYEWQKALYGLKESREQRYKLAYNAYKLVESSYTWHKRATKIIDNSLEANRGAKNKKLPLILHIIGDLNIGGAERSLVRLVNNINGKDFEHIIITLFSDKNNENNLKDFAIANGIKVIALGLPRTSLLFLPKNLKKLLDCISHYKPDIIQTWLYHSNNIINFLHVFLPKVPIINNIRHSEPLAGSTKTKITALFGALLSRISANTIICCSETSKQKHELVGYPKNKMLVIPNGFDVSDADRAKSRVWCQNQFNIPKNHRIGIIVGRFCLEKDYHNFCTAVGIVTKKFTDVTFIMCGRDIDENNNVLNHYISDNGLEAYVIRLGQRKDCDRLMAASDFLISSSSSEAFPNVIAEAMSVETPCVATDVGESSTIIGDTGICVPPKNPEALADAIITILEEPTRLIALGKAAKLRIQTKYSLNTTSNLYQSLYNSVLYKLPF